jgi:hypothetical protein
MISFYTDPKYLGSVPCSTDLIFSHFDPIVEDSYEATMFAGDLLTGNALPKGALNTLDNFVDAYESGESILDSGHRIIDSTGVSPTDFLNDAVNGSPIPLVGTPAINLGVELGKNLSNGN